MSGSHRHVVIGVYWLCRLFHDDPATSARFSHLDPRDRSHAPPCQCPLAGPTSRCVHGCASEEPSILQSAPMRPLPRVIIVGAGFGGLQCARKLAGEPVDVTIVDRQNYHLFTPLLYQVASCLLNPSEITAPVRKVFRDSSNVRYRQGEVVDVDFSEQTVRLADGETLHYDEIVLATGSTTNYYGNDALEQRALGLKDLGQALQLRNHVLECLERAAATTDPRERRRLLTFCI